MNKGGAVVIHITFLERAARGKITITDCEDGFLVMLFRGVE
jgi:hypothetical protein